MDIPGYRDFRLLAEGGMATVYVAEQASLGREVAIKVLKQVSDPALSERFVNEGRIIASLNNRNVITIYDIGTVGGHNYLSMEYLRGGDLEGRITAGMTVDAALDVALSIAKCLAFVHAKGIVHRDIKPANILFHDDGTPILTDFGIARQQQADTRLTMDGTTLGSPHYLSPEQGEGKPVDARADIYSLGVVLYEMLTGAKPFRGDSYVTIVMAHLSEPVPRLPESLARFQPLLDRMLAKKPGDRFTGAAELVAALEQLRQAAARGDPAATLSATAPPRRDPADASSPTLVANLQTGGATAASGGGGAAATEAHGGRARWTRHALAGLAVLGIAAVGVALLREEGPAPSRVIPIAPATVTPTVSAPSTTAARSGAESAQARAEREAREREAARREARERAIAERLRNAERALQARRLSVPAEDSAYYWFNEVLELDPGNAAAKRGLERVADAYADLAAAALEDYKHKRAKAMVARGLAIDPDNPRLLALEKETSVLKNAPKQVLKDIKSIFD